MIITKPAETVLVTLARYIEQSAFKILKSKNLKNRAKVNLTLEMYYLEDGMVIGTNPMIPEDNAPFVINFSFAKRDILSSKRKEEIITSIALQLCRGNVSQSLVYGKVIILSRKWELVA